MKHTLFLLLIALSVNINCQSRDQTRIVGGNLNIHSISRSFEAALNPNLGVFINDNVFIGASADLSVERYPLNNVHTEKLLLGPSLRYYTDLEQLLIFPEVKVTTGIYWTGYLGSDDEMKTTRGMIFSLEPGIGIDIPIASNVYMESIISYRLSQYASSFFTNNYDFKISYMERAFNLSLGFKIFLSHE